METVAINHTAYQKKVRSIETASLQFIIRDCQEAIRANPNGPKAGYYADEINYCSMELRRRQDAGR